MMYVALFLLAVFMLYRMAVADGSFGGLVWAVGLLLMIMLGLGVVALIGAFKIYTSILLV